MEGCLISPSRSIYEPGIMDKPRYMSTRLKMRRKTWASLLDRPQSAPTEGFFRRFPDIYEDEVMVSVSML